MVSSLNFRDQCWAGLERLIVDSELGAAYENSKIPLSIHRWQQVVPVHDDMHSVSRDWNRNTWHSLTKTNMRHKFLKKRLKDAENNNRLYASVEEISGFTNRAYNPRSQAEGCMRDL